MESRDLPRIGLLDVDKASAEALGPVIHLDKNGFFYCMQGCLKLALDGRVFELRSGDMYIYPPFSQTYIGEMRDAAGNPATRPTASSAGASRS